MDSDRLLATPFGEFSGASFVVTGASSGIGRQVAIDLSRLGARVALIARNPERLALTRSLMDDPARHREYSFDLTRTEETAGLLQEINAEFGPLSGLVYCAGVSPILPLRLLRYEHFDRTMRVNLYSFVEMVRAYAARTAGNRGAIVGISSSAANMGEKGQSIYAASKAAMDAAVHCLAQELAERQLRINTLRPGLILTEMTESFQARSGGNDFLAEQTARQLLGLGKPEDVSRFAIFLLSSLAGFCTGRSYQVDGGRLR